MVADGVGNGAETVYAEGGPGFVVQRDRLVRDVLAKCDETGVVIVSAPQGFGKTSLLMQSVAAVRANPARGATGLVGARGLSCDELLERLEDVSQTLPGALRPLIAIDDVPSYTPVEVTRLAEEIGRMRERQCDVLMATEPQGEELAHGISRASVINAHALMVRPREYAGWAQSFSIPHTLDVYDLTLGIPSLVVALQAASAPQGTSDQLAIAIGGLYDAALKALGADTGVLHRLLCLFVLLGQGSMTDLERCGLRVKPAQMMSFARDYPLVRIDVESRGFCCLGTEGDALEGVRELIARTQPSLLIKAIRILMKAGRAAEAVAYMRTYLTHEESLEIISQFPVSMVVAGQGIFVREVIAQLPEDRFARIDVSAQLSLLLASLTMGDYRIARAMSTELSRRAAEIEAAVSVVDWGIASALVRVWGSCSGVSLPELSSEYERTSTAEHARLLDAHVRCYRAVIALGEDVEADLVGAGELKEELVDDIPRLLLVVDRLLREALEQGVREVGAADDTLKVLRERLDERRLAPPSARVRMVAALRRLLAGLPVVDERAFSDAGTVAVREYDQMTQLFCLAGEGWQSLALGQTVNAQFRGQQILKLVDEQSAALRAWAHLLERTAYLMGTSRMGIRDEAELLDLSAKVSDPIDAWTVAMHLSAARFDSDLSAWFSLHKKLLLCERVRPRVRLALSLLGAGAASVRRLLPYRVVAEYDVAERAGEEECATAYEVVSGCVATELGQLGLRLLGGFSVMRNGHTITDALWRRKKASVLAARLALSIGTYISRKTISEELWPDTEYGRARQNTYVALTALRSAMRQGEHGPQYLLIQGDGIALNAEYVATDITRFDGLAREILLKRTGISNPQVIEACLKVEELYTGPLYVPDSGDTRFFVRMRGAYLSRYVDCMIRGIDIAVEEQDYATASWLASSVIQHAPLREDVIRRVMGVFNLCGRRREAVELYTSHLHYLQHELHGEPEEQTRLAYEQIVKEARGMVMI